MRRADFLAALGRILPEQVHGRSLRIDLYPESDAEREAIWRAVEIEQRAGTFGRTLMSVGFDIDGSVSIEIKAV